MLAGRHGLRSPARRQPLEQHDAFSRHLDVASARQVLPQTLGDACLAHRAWQGDPGDRLYVITTGSINVFSAAASASGAMPQRFVSLSPGMMLGETAMLDGGGRSGEAVADGETEVHALDAPTLQSLRSEDPLLYAQVHRNIAVHLSQRLRAAAWAWRASTS